MQHCVGNTETARCAMFNALYLCIKEVRHFLVSLKFAIQHVAQITYKKRDLMCAMK